ncbi:diacylglycerol/lipid kinase family protein [Actinotignum timonense]|uniref:diacylglycerol/lipid kinase family protein n=1 Tax=Actinotignum timonense TaxID=1870995 RepID=UPI00254EE75F|nr:diacylglycerol kinase family protein [Actinotignum timonense]MDK8781808.1 diacylglycerol kinase family protein [Actinotignum timonense]
MSDSAAQQHQHNGYPEGQRQIRRVVLLTNPTAGKGRATSLAAHITAELLKHGVDVVGNYATTVAETRKNARAALADPGIDALVACGGDGLANLIVQEQAGTGKPLGLVAGGTGNDIARGLGIPLDVAGAARTIASGYTLMTDLGLATREVNGVSQPERRYFASILAAGIDTRINARAKEIRWPGGSAAYFLAVLAEVAAMRTAPLTLSIDGGEPFTLEATLCAVGNTRSYGGGIRMCSHADPRDGKLALTVVGPVSRRTAARNLRNIYTGDFSKLQDIVTQIQVNSVRLEMPDLIPAVDGEDLFPTPLTVTVAAGAGCFLVPPPRQYRSQTHKTN